jgi:hypothetical protein
MHRGSIVLVRPSFPDHEEEKERGKLMADILDMLKWAQGTFHFPVRLLMSFESLLMSCTT